MIYTLIEPVRICTDKYLKSKNVNIKQEFVKYVNLIEISDKYNDKIKVQVEEMLVKLKNNMKLK